MNSSKFDVALKDLLDVLDSTDELCGRINIRINQVAAIDNPWQNSIVFCTDSYWKDEYLKGLCDTKNTLIILSYEINKSNEILAEKNCVIHTKNPKLLYVKLVAKALLVSAEHREFIIKNNVSYGENVRIGKGTLIEPFVFIDHDVVIGENCVIRSGARIRSNVVIGNSCLIGENSIIGQTGLSIATDDDGVHYRIPHLGGVIIKNQVEIGADNTIASGTIEPTILNENVMTGEKNQISHNCIIGRGAIISGNVVLTGGVQIGEYVWVGPNATIINEIKIGKYSKISIGSVVFKDVEEGITVTGNPARKFCNEKSNDIKNVIPNMHNRNVIK